MSPEHIQSNLQHHQNTRWLENSTSGRQEHTQKSEHFPRHRTHQQQRVHHNVSISVSQGEQTVLLTQSYCPGSIHITVPQSLHPRNAHSHNHCPSSTQSHCHDHCIGSRHTHSVTIMASQQHTQSVTQSQHPGSTYSHTVTVFQ